jgi:hypothetical protein
MRMGRNRGEEGCGDKYLSDDRACWRRRFFILCGGIVALGACAWLFPAAHQPSAREAAATRASVAALTKRQALPPVAFGSPWAEPPRPTPTPSAAATGPVKGVRKVSAAHHPSPLPPASGSTGRGRHERRPAR